MDDTNVKLIGKLLMLAVELAGDDDKIEAILLGAIVDINRHRQGIIAPKPERETRKG